MRKEARYPGLGGTNRAQKNMNVMLIVIIARPSIQMLASPIESSLAKKRTATSDHLKIIVSTVELQGKYSSFEFEIINESIRNCSVL
jgi:hypothetical protein